MPPPSHGESALLWEFYTAVRPHQCATEGAAGAGTLDWDLIHERKDPRARLRYLLHDLLVDLCLFVLQRIHEGVLRGLVAVGFVPYQEVTLPGPFYHEAVWLGTWG